MAPTNVPGNFRINFRAIHQRVDHVMIVFYVHIAGLERGGSGRKIDCDCVFGNWDRPEQPTVGGPRVEIVNLLTRRVKNVKSYERKGAMVIATVRAHKFAAHETHVGFEVKVLRSFANHRVRARAAHRGPAYETVEVGDGGRLDTGSR
jgi:hypothetical protein